MRYQQIYESLKEIGYTDEEAIDVIKRSYPSVAIKAMEKQNDELVSALKEAKFVLEWMWNNAVPLTAADHSDFFNLTANCLTVIDKQLEQSEKVRTH